jgi:hypothetical protein
MLVVEAIQSLFIHEYIINKSTGVLCTDEPVSMTRLLYLVKITCGSKSSAEKKRVGRTGVSCTQQQSYVTIVLAATR